MREEVALKINLPESRVQVIILPFFPVLISLRLSLPFSLFADFIPIFYISVNEVEIITEVERKLLRTFGE